MNKRALIVVIGLMLMIFVLVRVVITQLCTQEPSNKIVSTAVETISTAITPTPHPPASAPEPLSWTPVLNQVLAFFSKACNR